MKKAKKKVVVVGGGFAGINVVDKLDPNLFEITLIDKVNHHQFQPLMYQVAASQIEPSSISFPLRYIFRKKQDILIRMAEVESVDIQDSFVNTDIGKFDYDYLILAMGCRTNFFNNEELSNHALTLKSTYDAINIRNHILQNFEDIINEPEKRDEGLYNIVIVGAGPTGVELSGAFAEIKKNILPKDFNKINFDDLKIILVEGGDNVLNSMSEKSHKTSEKYLKKLGVEVLKNTSVVSYDGEVMEMGNGEKIKTKTLIWAAGVIANTIDGIPEEYITRGNRIKVNRINQLEASDNVFVIGDMAMMETENYPHGHPQLANVAINQGKNLAKNLKRIEEGKETVDYSYKDLGTMATVGFKKAVVDLPFVHFKGVFAWLVWMFLHLMLILSVKNKLIIFINWAWAYITKNTSLRIILKRDGSQ